MIEGDVMAQNGYGRGGDVGVSWRIWIPPVSISGRRESRQHILLWQVRGVADLTVAGEVRPLTAGHAMWVPVGVQHEFTVHANSVTMPLFFPAAETATTLCGPTLIAVDRALRTLMLAYTVSLHTLVKPQADLARQILALIEDIPVLSTALAMPTSEAPLLIAETLRFNAGDTRSVEELAESVNTSLRSIERAFRAEVGMTLREWRIRNRMEAAALLLRSGASPEAVAHRVGYTSVNAFRRVFKGHFGLSPTEYLNRYRTQR